MTEIDITQLLNYALFFSSIAAVMVLVLRAERRVARLESYLNSMHEDLKTIKDEIIRRGLK